MSPEPKYYAFYDVDGTIINIKSMFSFLEFYREYAPEPFKLTNEPHRSAYEKLMDALQKKCSREEANRLFYRLFSGIPQAELSRLTDKWATMHAGSISTWLIPSVVSTIRFHQAQGAEIVLVSGSFQALLWPIINALSIDHCLATNMEVENQIITGEITLPQTIGAGKAEAIDLFLQDKNISSKNCFAYGDDISDVPMLTVVGYPTAVIGDSELELFALKHHWPIINLRAG